ncbi:unnamed protein product [Blepharisma stoltei]|uniref:Uncharacterized protein n=1 Tax=Blepharisma stoltei TaxID=1481888 RepID=A0AAU9K7D0_9CILI|nr:unnamed protein product [Blepharisma stoltei]
MKRSNSVHPLSKTGNQIISQKDDRSQSVSPGHRFFFSRASLTFQPLRNFQMIEKSKAKTKASQLTEAMGELSQKSELKEQLLLNIEKYKKKITSVNNEILYIQKNRNKLGMQAQRLNLTSSNLEKSRTGNKKEIKEIETVIRNNVQVITMKNEEINQINQMIEIEKRNVDRMDWKVKELAQELESQLKARDYYKQEVAMTYKQIANITEKIENIKAGNDSFCNRLGSI